MPQDVVVGEVPFLVVERRNEPIPGISKLRLREAELLKRRGDYQGARTLLETGGEPVSDPDTLEARAYLLGDLCDRLGDSQAAFRYIVEANRRCQSSFADRRLRIRSSLP